MPRNVKTKCGAAAILGGALLMLSAAPASAHAQAKQKKGPRTSAQLAKDSAKLEKAVKESERAVKFYADATPITVTLTTNMKRIKGDRGDQHPWRPATLSYAATAPDTGKVVIPIKIKTRGIWRLKNCEFPPIWLNFSNEGTKHTVFRGLNETKLVSYCRNNDEFERYVVQEFQLYRALHLLTPASHAVRPLRVTYVDSASGKTEATRFAFLEEELPAVAARLGGRVVNLKGASPDDLEPLQDAIDGIFQYMIGNTDFAMQALHNVELLAMSNGDYVPVIYDFDFSGAVNTRYATVDPQLQNRIRVVRDRLFRGFCVPQEYWGKAFAVFNAKKDSIYALYRDPVGKLLPEDVTRETLKYFDDFYKTLDNPRDAKNEIIDQCLGGKR